MAMVSFPPIAVTGPPPCPPSLLGKGVYKWYCTIYRGASFGEPPSAQSADLTTLQSPRNYDAHDILTKSFRFISSLENVYFCVLFLFTFFFSLSTPLHLVSILNSHSVILYNSAAVSVDVHFAFSFSFVTYELINTRRTGLAFRSHLNPDT